METLELFASDRKLALPEQVSEDINNGALVFCSHSAGKYSQAMYLRLRDLVPHDQLIVVHAHLGEAEWPGVIEHIEATTDHPLNVVEADRTFLDMVLRRTMFPDARNRLCTSTLKTGPIRKFIRRVMNERGATVAYNCTGIRAQESRSRAQKTPLSQHKALCTKARTVWDWLPIFDMSEAEVYDVIEAAGQQPHFAYGHRGDRNGRLSCRFCVLGCQNDLRNSAEDDPYLYAMYTAVENITGHTMFTRSKTVGGVRQTIPMPLAEKTGIPVDPQLLSEVTPIIHRRFQEQQAIQARVGQVPAKEVA